MAHETCEVKGGGGEMRGGRGGGGGSEQDSAVERLIFRLCSFVTHTHPFHFLKRCSKQTPVTLASAKKGKFSATPILVAREQPKCFFIFKVGYPTIHLSLLYVPSLAGIASQATNEMETKYL